MAPHQSQRSESTPDAGSGSNPTLDLTAVATAEATAEAAITVVQDTPRPPEADAPPGVDPRPPIPDAPSSSLFRFPPPLEAEYAAYNFGESLVRLRGAIVLAIVLYAVFALLDNWIAPEQRQTLWLIRLTVVTCAVAGLAFSYSPAFQKWWQSAIWLLIAVGAFGIIAMLAVIPAPGNHLYYAGLLLLTIYYATLIRLGITYAATLSAVIFVSYVITAMAMATPTVVLFNNVMMLIAGNIIALTANVAFERHSRRDFWQRRVIRERAQQLETRNAQLSAANAELVRSRAEVARSAERNQLLFAALTEALPGTVLDEKYRLDQKIGSGGFGTVYRAYHLLLRRPVAVKLLKPTAGDMVSNVARFKREAITACKLAHPNAVHVFDFGVSGGSVAYLVMELLEGVSLAEELERRGPMSIERCGAIVEPLCDVLAEAHRLGLIHRDLKPSNVFLHQSGGHEVVKVIDFGLSKVVGPSGSELQSVHATATGGLVGTPAYMAPERLLGNDGDEKSDVYALGVMVFELVCGEKPFVSDSDAHWASAIKGLTDRPTPLRVKNPAVPESIGDIVDRALSRDARDRPTVHEFGERYLAALKTAKH